MDFLLPFSPPAMASMLAFFMFLYHLFWRQTRNKRLPVESGGAWPLIGHLHLLGGPKPAHKTLGNMADKHGPIFTIKLGLHRALIVSSSEIAKECLTTNDRVFANRSKTLGAEVLTYNYGVLGFAQYGLYWRQLRKIVTLELLSNHRLEMLKDVRTSEVKLWVNELYKLWVLNKNSSNKVLVDMKRWLGDITLNIIFRIIVGKRYVDYSRLHEDEEKKRCREALRDFLELIGKFAVSDALPFLRWLDLGGVERDMKKTATELDQVLQKWLEEHKQKSNSSEGKGEQDFMDVMLSILDDAHEELHTHDADRINKATCLALILGASDTTSVTLIWVLSLLVNHRDVLKKAQQELGVYIGRERQVQESDMKNLVYLQAIIKETMRLYPALPLLVPHESMEDCTIGGYHIPARTRIIFNVHKIQRDPDVWLNPTEFRPERFLTTHKSIDVRGQNFELMPFGSGRRICPGISFSLQVMQLTLATLLHGFEIGTQSDEAIDMVESSGLVNGRASPLEIFLNPRLPANLYDQTQC